MKFKFIKDFLDFKNKNVFFNKEELRIIAKKASAECNENLSDISEDEAKMLQDIFLKSKNSISKIKSSSFKGSITTFIISFAPIAYTFITDFSHIDMKDFAFISFLGSINLIFCFSWFYDIVYYVNYDRINNANFARYEEAGLITRSGLHEKTELMMKEIFQALGVSNIATAFDDVIFGDISLSCNGKLSVVRAAITATLSIWFTSLFMMLMHR
jgi:hypothetical protein